MVGLPRESRISRARISLIAVAVAIGLQSPQGRHLRASCHDVTEAGAGSKIESYLQALSSAQVANPKRCLYHRTPFARHVKCPRLGARGDDLLEASPDEMSPGTVVEREGRHKSPADEPMERRAPRRFAIVVGAESPAQEAQPTIQPPQTVSKRISDAVLEPADCASAETCQHCPAVPRRAQCAIQSVQPPDGEQIRGTAATDVDNILLEDELSQVPHRACEELEVSRSGPRRREQFMKPCDV